MGTLKMLHMKQCKGENKSRHLKNALQYIFNPEKFSERWMGGNAGSNADEVYSSMMRLKKMFGKENGRQGYHFILTFKPGEVDENLACRITEEFCEIYLKNEYQHTFVLHNDKAHMHTHIIFNSIDMKGNKYHYADGDWAKKIQPVVNELCKKYGLSEINLEKKMEDDKNVAKKNKTVKGGSSEKKAGKNTKSQKNAKDSKGENKKNSQTRQSEKADSKGTKTGYKMKWQAEREKLRKQVREDINSSITMAECMEDFYDIMEEKGYRIHIGHSKTKGEFISFKFKERPGVRSYILGAGFSVDDIKYQIQNKEKLSLADQKFRDAGSVRYKRIYFHSPESLRRLYLKNTYLIRNWKGERLSMYPQMYKYRKSLEELKQIEEECRYICDMKIESMEQIDAQLNYVNYRIKDLGRLRYSIINGDTEILENVEKEEKLREITNDFKRFMKEKMILERIKSKSAQMEKNEQDIEEEKEKIRQKEAEELEQRKSKKGIFM